MSWGASDASNAFMWAIRVVTGAVVGWARGEGERGRVRCARRSVSRATPLGPGCNARRTPQSSLGGGRQVSEGQWIR